MKKINGKFVPSATEKSRAMAHARALSRQKTYDGSIDVYFDVCSGKFHFYEIVGLGYVPTESEYIGSVKCQSWS